jgi:phage baseplate assembly protein W
MAHTPGMVTFTLEDIHRSAREILEADPDGVVASRLFAEVLRISPERTEMMQAKKAALDSKWVRQLDDAQLPDGSWGRFHSQDTKKKTVFRTTEEAIDRAFALGLGSDHRILIQARKYILQVLHGDARIRDRRENNEAWPLLVKLILAGRLAQIDPTNKMLHPFWRYLSEVVEKAFASGKYNLEDESAAHLRLSGKHVPLGFLESQHALWILSTQPLPNQLGHALLEWVWNKPDGIRYLRAQLSAPQPRHIGYWLRSMNILSRFDCWREICTEPLNHVWGQRDEHRLWDYGCKISRCIDFPLSENWRKVRKRKMDYSTYVLVLLRKYFD